MRRTAFHIWKLWPSIVVGVFIVWFLFIFTPTVSVQSTLDISGRSFAFENHSYKTPLSNVLCNKPSLAIIVFTDSAGNKRSVLSNAPGYGTGSSKITIWKSTGTIPLGLNPGTIAVRKKLVYPCIWGTARDVFSDYHYFKLEEPDR